MIDGSDFVFGSKYFCKIAKNNPGIIGRRSIRNLESVVLWQEGREGLVLLNAVGSVVAGIILVWLGMLLHRGVLGE